MSFEVVSSYAKFIDSSIGLKANSLFLNKYSVPKPFMFILASLPVFLLTSTRAVKISPRRRLTCSLVAFVTSDREAKERRI